MGFKSDLDETIKLGLKIGAIWLKNVSGKLLIRNSTDTNNAILVCHEIEAAGDSVTLNSDASDTGNDRSIRIQRSLASNSSYILTLPPNAGSTGDVITLSSPGVLSFAPPGGNGGNAGSLEGFTASQLRDRGNHTGTQPASSITGLGSAAFFSSSSFVNANDLRLSIFTPTQSGIVPAPGTGANRFLREDGSWQAISSGGSGGSGDFINGGNTASADLFLGSNNNFGVNFETNNLSRLSIAPNGAVNIWDGQNRWAVPSGYMQPGSLTIGSTNRDYGGATTNWNSNTAGLLFECSDYTEGAIHDSNTRLVSLFRYNGPENRITWGRDMGSGINNYHLISRHFLMSHRTNFNFYNLGYPFADDSRTNVVIAGIHPHLYLISNQTGNGSHSNGLSFAEMLQGSSNNARQWHFAQANFGRYFQIGYIESADFNPHLGIQNHGSTTLLSLVAPGQSSNLGSRAGISLNGRFDPEYHLDLNDGSIGWGINNTRTERKNDAGASGSLVTKQSGFFDADSPSNFYTGANGWQHLIDCKHGNNSSYALQIAAAFNANFDGLWWRTTNGNATQSWNKILSSNNGQSNAWLSRGNNNIDHSQDFIGTINNADIVFKRNNAEAFRVPSQNVIQVNCQNGYGNPLRPHYSFYWNWGEDDGMYLEADGVLCFSVQGTKRLSISASNNRIEAHGFSFRTDQGYWVGPERVINSKSSIVINTLAPNASLSDVISTINQLILVHKNHHSLFS